MSSNQYSSYINQLNELVDAVQKLMNIRGIGSSSRFEKLPASRIKSIMVRQVVLNPRKKGFFLQTVQSNEFGYEVDANVFVTCRGLALPHQDGGFEIVSDYYTLGEISGRIGHKKLKEMESHIISKLAEFSD